MNDTKQYDGILRGLPEPALTTEEENSLAKRIQLAKRGGDEAEDLINTLVLHTMREAFYYALACSKNLDAGSVYSLCYTALRAAAGNFKPCMIRFFAYAKPYVRGEICRAYDALKVVHKADHETLIVDEVENEITEPVESPLPGIMVKDDIKVLMSVVNRKLSEKERMILQLVYEGGFNFRQIGELLRVTRSDAQATHSRAIQKLRYVVSKKATLIHR